ncbi:hypothetical protein [Paenibacillus sp. 8b26]|uniref:hypothetical protein n=1 Tax=Paenibacillus sp. 8b26 TaxID=3424133 RepID=UPI003D649699
MKKFAIILSTLLLFVVGAPNIYAAQNEVAVPQPDVVSTTIVVDGAYKTVSLDNGDVVSFLTKEDYDSYVAASNDKDTTVQLEAVDSVIRPSSTHIDNTFISGTTRDHQFINYHEETPYWAKASNYTVTRAKTYTASTTLKYDDVSFNVGVSYMYSVATQIPADPSRFSRLGVSADLTLKKYRAVQYDDYTGQRISSWDFVATNVRNTYLAPAYQ